ncbi:flagellar biosynthesis anti-sigma factor FlgM [Erythrobacter sp. MTPC3]|uniref:flagellar biosynthesis anti-sigma factor FlgM n=1 Tax=Erythrobacter sp. MTPC3 TaxID=3056564 RepID=UPI0036F44D52
MSPLDIQRLSAITASSAIGAGGKPETGPHAAPNARPAPAPEQGVSVEVRGTTDAGSPIVDSTRVAEIRDALKDGSYPIVPSEIADALIAARLMLGYAE